MLDYFLAQIFSLEWHDNKLYVHISQSVFPPTWCQYSEIIYILIQLNHNFISTGDCHQIHLTKASSLQTTRNTHQTLSKIRWTYQLDGHMQVS